MLKNRPYKYTQTMKIIHDAYAIAKTIIAILNAIAILILMYLAIEWKSFI